MDHCTHPFGIGRILHTRGVLFNFSCSFLADRSASWLSCLFCDSSFSTCFKASSRCCLTRSTCACKFLISSCMLLIPPFPALAPGLYLPLFRFWPLLLLLRDMQRDKHLCVQSMGKSYWLIHKGWLNRTQEWWKDQKQKKRKATNSNKYSASRDASDASRDALDLVWVNKARMPRIISVALAV